MQLRHASCYISLELLIKNINVGENIPSELVYQPSMWHWRKICQHLDCFQHILKPRLCSRRRFVGK